MARVLDPILQLDEFPLQPEQLTEVANALRARLRVRCRIRCSLARARARHAAVVELHLQLFIQAVQHVLMDTSIDIVRQGGIVSIHVDENS